MSPVPGILSTASRLRALLRQGLFEQAEADARRAVLRIDELDGAAYRSARAALPWVWCAAGEVMWAIGDDRAAVPLLERARRDSVTGARLLAFADLACLHAVIGDLPRAEAGLEQLDAALGAAPSRIVEAAVHARSCAARGVIALSRLRLDEAADAATQLAEERQAGDLRTVIATLLRAGESVLSGRAEHALSALAQLTAEQPLPAALAAAVKSATSAAALSSGELGFVMTRSVGEGRELGHQHVCHPSYEAIALLAVGRPELAVRCTDECAQGVIAHSSRTTLFLLAVRAAAFQAMGRTESAVACLVRLSPLWAEAGVAEFCALPARHRATLLELAEKRGALPSFVVTVLADRPRTALDRVAEAFGELTAREWEILRWLGSASTLEEIAQQLFSSRSTIASHCRGIYLKLGVGSRSDAVEMARRAGVFDVLGG